MARATTGRPGPRTRPGGRVERPRGNPRDAAHLAAATVTAVTDLVTEPLYQAGFDLEDVSVTRAGARHVVALAVDRDGGLDLDAVADASRIVSDVLDAHDDALPMALRGAYTLEVSSRGATAPLVAPRHWRRAVGRLVVVRRRGADPVTGRITAADDEGADLAVDGSPVRVELADVVRAVVQLEFRKLGENPGDVADLEETPDLEETANLEETADLGDLDEEPEESR